MKLKVGLIGAGGMGLHLAKMCNQLETAEVVALCDENLATAEKAGKELKAPYFKGRREMLESSAVEAVIIATPNYLHAPIAIEAAVTKKHIFVEKPMALCIEDCDKMIQTARENKVKLMVGQVLRFISTFAKVKEIIESAILGKPVSMFTARISDWGFRGWRNKRQCSGGILMEINSHELDYMRYICGDVETVYAAANHYIKKQVNFEDIAFVSLKFKSGAIGCLHSSIASSLGEYSGKIQCELGTIFYGGWGNIRYKPFEGTEVVIEAKDIQIEEPVKHEVRLFIESIISGTEPAVPGEEGRAAIELAQAAHISAKTGEAVRLPLRTKM